MRGAKKTKQQKNELAQGFGNLVAGELLFTG